MRDQARDSVFEKVSAGLKRFEKLWRGYKNPPKERIAGAEDVLRHKIYLLRAIKKRCYPIAARAW